jgi:hypothetical protein
MQQQQDWSDVFAAKATYENHFEECRQTLVNTGLQLRQAGLDEKKKQLDNVINKLAALDIQYKNTVLPKLSVVNSNTIVTPETYPEYYQAYSEISTFSTTLNHLRNEATSIQL